MPALRASPTIGVVLAGGRSSRMGRDKALLDWHGQALHQHMQALLGALGIEDIRLSGQPQAGGIADRQPGLGPLGGLATLAETLPDAELLVLPVDMPCLPVATLQQLLHRAPAAACVHFQGHPLPLRLRLDQTLRAELQIRTEPSSAARQRSLRALAAALGAIELAVPEGQEACFHSCNTPEQWRVMRLGSNGP